MKIVRNIYIFLLLGGLQWGWAQNNYQTLDWSAKYSKEVSKLDSLSKIGKNRTAFELAENIFDLALTSRNIPGLIQSLDYMIGNSYRVDDDAMKMVLKKVGTAKAIHPVITAFLHSYLGELLTMYYERNRYRISQDIHQRVDGKINWTSLDKWGAFQLEDIIDSLYRKSISPEELIAIPSEKASVMLDKQTGAIHFELKPRLYDLLQSRHLEYLKNRRLNWSFQDFVPTAKELGLLTKLDLSDYLKTHTEDSGFNKTLLAFDRWEKSLRTTDYKEAYVDVLLERNNFIRGRLNIEDHTPLIKQLNSLVDLYPSVKNQLSIYQSISNIYFNKGKYPEALHVINEGLINAPKNSYDRLIDEANQLIYRIKAPELDLSVEEVYTSKQNPLVSISFRNMDKMKLELHSLTESEFINGRFSIRNNEKGPEYLTNKNKIWQKIINLPNSTDYKRHRTEALVENKLDKGTYALKYWYKKDSVELSGFALFQVSDLALISKGDQNAEELYVLNRKTGRLVKEAKVEAITFLRYPTFKKSEIRILRESDKGRFILPQKQLNLYYKVTSGDDRYISPLTHHNKIHQEVQQPVYRTVLFVDRAIYQPGNTIHFKALTVVSGKLNTQILKGQEINISFRDSNGQEVWKKNYKTDEWGSVTGTIPIPVDGLSGSWYLQSSPSGQARIQVEEYQRPMYEINVEDKDIRRKDSIISLAGKVQTYHGFPIQDGKVVARVELEKQHWFYSRRPETTKVVHNSEFTTDENGQFEMEFTASRVLPRNNSYGSFYFYSIYLTVQAGSGEIREWSKTIPLDPDEIQVQLNHPMIYLSDQKLTPTVGIKNAMNESASQLVHLEVSRLTTPETFKVDRYWALPDQAMMSASEFRKRVPYMFYEHNGSIEHWGKERTLITWSQDLSDNDTIELEKVITKPGYYRIEIFSDKGDTLSSASFGVVDRNSHRSLFHEAMELIPDKMTVEPGDSVELLVFSALGLEDGILTVSRSNGISTDYNISDNRLIQIPVTESDRGGIHLSAFGYFANRAITKTLFLDVPWSNKELHIVQNTPLSRVEVNVDTTLNIGVLDNGGVGYFAEVAVVVYDASLDAYIPHGWNTPFQFFQMFRNTIRVRNLGGRLAQVMDQKNTYWHRNAAIRPLNIPELPRLNMGYGGMLHARNKNVVMSSVPPASLEIEEMKNFDGIIDEAGGVLDAEQDQNSSHDLDPSLRSDFSETLLFYGKLKTDASGNLEIPIHTNDKTGRWNVLVFSHRTDLSYGYQKFSFETFRELYIESFMPGMVRQGDSLVLNFTLYNTTAEAISGQVQFEVSSLFSDDSAKLFTKNIDFDLSGERSSILSLPISIEREESGPLVFIARIVDESGKLWDAIQETIPVLPASENIYDGRVVILEKGQDWSGAEIGNKVLNKNGEVEIRIVQNMYTELMKSIPYLQHSNPITTDQYFSNGMMAMMGEYLAGQIPDFKEIYKEWKRKGELESRLSQNVDKKYVSLENTPWVRESTSGTEQMALLGLYFDKSFMQEVIQSNISSWVNSQNADGGFPWIDNGPSNFYITVRFLRALGKMRWAGLSVPDFTEEKRNAAITYLDSEFFSEWKRMKERTPQGPISYDRFIPYFIQRAYFVNEVGSPTEHLEAWGEMKDSIYANWAEKETALRADIGIAAWHLGDKEWSLLIADAFQDNAIHNSNLGVYWKYGHRSVQSDYLAVLSGITELLLLNDIDELNDGIFQWVLVNNMTNDWQSNPAVSSLMLSLVKMKNNFTETSRTYVYRNGIKEELMGIGDVDEIRLSVSELQSFRIDHPSGPPLWIGLIWSGAVDPEDSIEQSGNVLYINKSVHGADSLKSIRMGEQLTIRLVITTDRDLDYVYIEDPLLPGLDPGISLSGFTWKLGLRYYQTFSSSASRFFIEHLPKGEHLIEYKVGVVREGVFRHPRTKIQSYFVPEITGFDQWRPVVRIIDKNGHGQ